MGSVEINVIAHVPIPYLVNGVYANLECIQEIISVFIVVIIVKIVIGIIIQIKQNVQNVKITFIQTNKVIVSPAIRDAKIVLKWEAHNIV